MLASSAFALKPIQKDSLITEVSNNLVYIIHKVQPGQTFYSLINKYNASVSEVTALNPALKNTVAINVGQVLKFPMIKNGKHVSSWAYNKEKNLVNNKVNPTPKPIIEPKKEAVQAIGTSKPESSSADKGKLHLIKAGDTIFSIAKFYDINISDLVEANGISDNKIKIGGTLIVDKEAIIKELKTLEKTKTPAFELRTIGQKVTEQGIAEVINTNNRTTKYLALYRKAKVGSIIKVTNEANGASITARVVANLNAVGPDQETMLKLSPYAFYKLGPKDSKIRAKVEFYVPAAKQAATK